MPDRGRPLKLDDETTEASVPSVRTGYCIVISSILFFALGSYATLFSAFYPHTGIPVSARSNTAPLRPLERTPQILDVLARDTHYKYFALFLIPTTSYFVIANWVGWQYYRNS
ncbi:uncharacterized protein B0H18DRAFT_1114657 [Fomitopsis serialis]|uniref:uncharacterized protein n=1 Tax=Fomitopsis serialis TaxID=139415 RepID=UPI002008CA63|nr:uncharacterized protein B0H18DRAFT_1114657 [Neoantrodia serialis]KAH9934805.1 hypothetical protein B0H18DRAFT_1114657 [Neoantrodia serialis]